MSDFKDIASGLQEWSKNWLHDGDTIECKNCRQRQQCSHCLDEFKHKTKCSNRFAVFPWCDLAYMTDMVIKNEELETQMSIQRQQFNSFNEWATYASRVLTDHPKYNDKFYRAICFDAKGRRCQIGKDFMKARDEGTFPVRWWWPDQPIKELEQN